MNNMNNTNNKSYKLDYNRLSSNTSNLVYLHKTIDIKPYVCSCDICSKKINELKKSSTNISSLRRTNSLDNLKKIFYGSEQKPISFRQFFMRTTNSNKEDASSYRRPIVFRLPI